MSRAIKVESCLTIESECPKFRVDGKYCRATLKSWSGKGIAPTCPLSKWPSITEQEKKILLNVIDVGISEYMPIAEYKCPGKILKEKLKSIIDNLEVRDDEK